MINSTLVAHCGAVKVSYGELLQLPSPLSMGPRHQPVPHVELVDLLKEQLSRCNVTVQREDYAIQTQGAKLFGVFDLSGVAGAGERGYAMGFRSANDESLAIRVVAGTRVFVCDNLALSGNDIVMNRKHTTGLSLRSSLGEAINSLFVQYDAMDKAIERMQNYSLNSDAAKALIYDAFVKEDVPLRLLPHVNEWYFDSREQHVDATDCHPRSMWGLHNSFTRAIKVIDSPARQFEITQSVGAFLGLRS